MAKKQFILDGTTYDIGADAQNVDYSNAGMSGVSNAKGALDNLDARVVDIENPNNIIVEEYNESACTEIGKYANTNGSEVSSNSYKCTPHIAIPYGVRMYIKTDYTFGGYVTIIFQKANNSQTPLKVVSSGGAYSDWTEITIPNLARYFRFTLTNDTTKHISIKFVKQPSQFITKLKVASWNVAQFNYIQINDSNVDAKRKAYRDVFDGVNADIVCFSEFSTRFNRDDITNSKSQNEILGNYPYKKLDDGNDSYNYNAIFSKLRPIYVEKINFTSQTNGYTRYFYVATFRLNGKDVKVVATHFDFQNSTYSTAAQQAEDNTPQFEEIIALYADEPYVIICADFNVHKWDRNGTYVSGDGTDGYLNYKYFTNAGYTLMNFDYLNIVNPVDYDANNPDVIGDHIADNIAVKGFAMGKREYVNTGNLSDHLMVACELVML